MSDHLKYYKNIKSIPTLNLGDLNIRVLFKQRENFYFNLGITKQNFYKKSILELCSGTGYNAYFLNKFFKVKRIKLVDNNPESIKTSRKNLSKFKKIKIVNKNIKNFTSSEKFDYVIIENALDNFSNEKKIIYKLINLTSKKGNIILTIGDNFGIFSTKLRYVFSLILIEQSEFKNFNDKLIFLSKVFKPHLSYLSKNTRNEKKWVLDNILNHNWIKKKEYINYPKLIKFIKNRAIIQNVSPSFFKNFNWYKNFDLKNINNMYLDFYKKEKLNFLDFETKFENDINIDINIRNISNLIFNLKTGEKINKKIIKQIEREIKKINFKLSKLKKNNKISLALNEFGKLLKQFILNKKIKSETKHFKKLWGVYNQNVLLYKI
tara:strand:- start:5546 stop:6679 length:1134 start_codon:yes stop_codon:yes gene_type:complete